MNLNLRKFNRNINACAFRNIIMKNNKTTNKSETIKNYLAYFSFEKIFNLTMLSMSELREVKVKFYSFYSASDKLLTFTQT